jgi:hypothetical protein
VVFIVLDFTEDIEEEDTHIFVKVLMVQEELGEEGQILTIHWILVAVDLEDCDLVLLVAVDFIPWRMEEWTVLRVAMQLDL